MNGTTSGRVSDYCESLLGSQDLPVAETVVVKKNKGFQIREFFPFLRWLTVMSKEDLCKDLLAGITVGVLLIPQSMSYAALAHLPPQYGLYTGFIPLIVFALLTSSYHISVGPVAPVCVLVGDAVMRIVGSAAIDPITEYGNEQFILAASGLALVTGIILVAMSVLRLGFIVKFMSVPVMTGFVTGAAFIIFGNQLRGMFGLDCEKTSKFYSTFINAMAAMGTLEWKTTLLTVVSLVFLFGCKYFNAPRWFPAPFILMLVTTIVSYGCNFESMGIKIVGPLPSGIPEPTIPDIIEPQVMIFQGVIVALVVYVGSLGLAKSLARDSPFPYEINANSELVAYGLSSAIGSFFLGFPPAASFSRSALAFEMEARTPLHGIFTASLMCVALYLTVAFEFLPKCVLAVIIVMSVRRLFLNGFKELIYLAKARSTDFFECFLCMAAVCFLGITEGIIIGAALSFVNYIWMTSFTEISTDNIRDVRPEIETLRSDEGKDNLDRSTADDKSRQWSEGIQQVNDGSVQTSGIEEANRDNRIASFSISMPKLETAVVKPKAGLYYANASKVADAIKEAVKGVNKALVLDLMFSPFLDSTSARALLDALVDASDCVDRLVICNCCERVTLDLRRYSSSNEHKKVLERVKIFDYVHM